jgi:hypothetical protein
MARSPGFAVVATAGLLLVAAQPARGQFTTPSVTAIHGANNALTGITDGCIDMTWGKTYNGLRVVNDKAGVYRWTLTGRNFGPATTQFPAAKGTVRLNGRAVPIVSWTDTEIVCDPSGAQINPTVPWNWGPMCTTLQVVRCDGRSVSMAVNICPSVNGVIYGQCVFYTMIRRAQMSGNYPIYYPFTSFNLIGAGWVPQRGDLLCWTGGIPHQVIIESVQRTVNGNRIIYTLGISQQNADLKNGISTFTTFFVVTNTGVVMQRPQFANGSATATGWRR